MIPVSNSREVETGGRDGNETNTQCVSKVTIMDDWSSELLRALKMV